MLKKSRVTKNTAAGSDKFLKKTLFYNSQGAYSFILHVLYFNLVMVQSIKKQQILYFSYSIWSTIPQK